MRTKLFMVLAAALLLGADAPKQGLKSDQAKLQATLTALEKQGWDALEKKDAATFDKITADDLVAIFSEGEGRTSKQEILKALSDSSFSDIKMEDVQLLTLNTDAAILTYKVSYTSTDKGQKPQRGLVWASSGYVQRDGKWLNIFYQETKAKK